MNDESSTPDPLDPFEPEPSDFLKPAPSEELAAPVIPLPIPPPLPETASEFLRESTPPVRHRPVPPPVPQELVEQHDRAKKGGLKKALKIFGVIIGCIALLFLAVGGFFVFAVSTGLIPESGVVSAEQNHPRILEKLREMDVLLVDEKLQYVCFDDQFSVRPGGNLFTDLRVVSYEVFEGDFQLYDAFYHEIEDIEFEPAKEWYDSAIVTVTRIDGGSFYLAVDTTFGEDLTFYSALMEMWKAKGSE